MFLIMAERSEGLIASGRRAFIWVSFIGCDWWHECVINFISDFCTYEPNEFLLGLPIPKVEEHPLCQQLKSLATIVVAYVSTQWHGRSEMSDFL